MSSHQIAAVMSLWLVSLGVSRFSAVCPEVTASCDEMEIFEVKLRLLNMRLDPCKVT